MNAKTLELKQASFKSGAALRTFFRIADAWQLKSKEAQILLGLEARSTWSKWRSNPDSAKLPRDKLERLSYIFGIYKSLQILLPEPSAADQWIRKSNSAPLFGGKTALDRMLAGNITDLYVVRQYLDSQRGGKN